MISFVLTIEGSGRSVYQRFSGLLRGGNSSHLLNHMSREVREIWDENELKEIDTSGESLI